MIGTKKITGRDVQRPVIVDESVGEGGKLDLELGLATLLRQQASNGTGRSVNS